MAEKETGRMGQDDFLKLGGLAAASAMVAGYAPSGSLTLATFRAQNPEYDWVGTKDASGKYYQFGGLGRLLENIDLEGEDFSPADFTGTSPRGINAKGCDLRGSTFDAGYNDFSGFNADGALLGGCYMPCADLRSMKITQRTSFFDVESGGAFLAGSNAANQHFEGVDLRDVDAEHGKWRGVHMDSATRTIGLNLSHAEVHAA